MTGTWVQLTSGAWYDFDAGTIGGPFDFDKDVAIPLSRAPRFTGHTKQRGVWSVASHSVCVARTVGRITHNPGAALAGLLHDMHEAVIGDLSTPLGQHLGTLEIKRLKRDVQSALERAMDVPFAARAITPDVVEAIAEADLAALHVERAYLMAPCTRQWAMHTPDPDYVRIYTEEFQEYTRDPLMEPDNFLFDYHHLARQLAA